MRTFSGVEDLRAAVGTRVGESSWVPVDQSMIDTFAAATLDHQWIHVDPQRAAEGPFGATIAHGFLTLSLLSVMLGEAFAVEGFRMGVNYGLNRVRFTSPVRVGSQVRGVFDLADVTDVAGGIQVTTTVTVEIADADRPALVAEWLTRRYA